MNNSCPTVCDVRRLALGISGKSQFAVDVARVIKDRGVALEYGVAPGDPPAYVSFGSLQPTIRLRSGRPGKDVLNCHERYVLAHELGHILFDSEFGVRPTRGTYWEHEELCDEFATELLLPAGQIKPYMAVSGELVAQLILSMRLASVGQVPWFLATRALERSTKLAFGCVTRSDHASLTFHADLSPSRRTRVGFTLSSDDELALDAVPIQGSSILSLAAAPVDRQASHVACVRLASVWYLAWERCSQPKLPL